MIRGLPPFISTLDCSLLLTETYLQLSVEKNWHVNKQQKHIHARSCFGQTTTGKQRFRTLQNAVVQLDLMLPHESKEHVTQVNEKSLVFT